MQAPHVAIDMSGRSTSSKEGAAERAPSPPANLGSWREGSAQHSSSSDGSLCSGSEDSAQRSGLASREEGPCAAGKGGASVHEDLEAALLRAAEEAASGAWWWDRVRVQSVEVRALRKCVRSWRPRPCALQRRPPVVRGRKGLPPIGMAEAACMSACVSGMGAPSARLLAVHASPEACRRHHVYLCTSGVLLACRPTCAYGNPVHPHM